MNPGLLKKLHSRAIYWSFPWFRLMIIQSQYAHEMIYLADVKTSCVKTNLMALYLSLGGFFENHYCGAIAQ